MTTLQNATLTIMEFEPHTHEIISNETKTFKTESDIKLFLDDKIKKAISKNNSTYKDVLNCEGIIHLGQPFFNLDELLRQTIKINNPINLAKLLNYIDNDLTKIEIQESLF